MVCEHFALKVDRYESKEEDEGDCLTAADCDVSEQTVDQVCR